jgi:outer membrane protein OmpA-like peptidoglycan-associated protein
MAAGLLAGAALAMGGITMASATALAQGAAALGANPSECEISWALLGTAAPGCPPAPSLDLPGEEAPVLAAPARPAALPPGTMTVTTVRPAPPPPVAALKAAFLITFDFASARVGAESRAVLERIAAVMNAPTAGSARFRIVGHTDSTGPADGNLTLSRQRAQAVKDALVKTWHVKPERLEVLGKGHSEPVNAADPAAAENRRVEIINLGS